MFEKIGAAMGPQAKGLGGRQKQFFRAAQNSDPEISHRAAQRHSAKNKSFNTSLDSMPLSTDTDGTTQTQTTHLPF